MVIFELGVGNIENYKSSSPGSSLILIDVFGIGAGGLEVDVGMERLRQWKPVCR